MGSRHSPPDSDSQPHEECVRKPPRTIPSEQLLAGDRELLIQHGGDTYRLTVTRTGKLILHK
jgi:hemin uptake protein HemP